MKPRNQIVTGFASALAVAGGVLAADAIGPGSIAFPQGYEKWQLYATVDRYDSKQYRELYTTRKR